MTDEELDAYIEQAAKLARIPLTDEMRAQTRANLKTAEKLSRLVLDYPLDDESEPAPVFFA